MYSTASFSAASLRRRSSSRSSERPEHALGEELVERETRRDLDNASEHVGRHRIVPLGARLTSQRDLRSRVQQPARSRP